MNKYQKAWHQIKRTFYEHNWFEPNEVKCLEELVDLHTPMKIDNYFRHYTQCPKCETGLSTKVTYCPKCGQALDWSE